MLKVSLAALSVGVVLCGCSTRAPEPSASPSVSQSAPVAQAPAVTPTSATESPAPEVSYSYNPVGKPDPFRNRTEGACCVVQPVCEGPLCGYSLDELKLSGVISGMANPVAVIENPHGKAFQLHRGSKVGRNGGVVKQVLRDSIVVAEISHDGKGLPQEHETILRIQPDLPITMGE